MVPTIGWPVGHTSPPTRRPLKIAGTRHPARAGNRDSVRQWGPYRNARRIRPRLAW